MSVHDQATMRGIGQLDDEWDVECGVLKKEAMGLFSMFAQTFAVVANNNNDGIPISSRFL